jgi:hypothetical protein
LGVGVGEAARGWIKKEFAELAALSDELSSVDRLGGCHAG